MLGPVADERLHRRQLNALGLIGDDFPVGPPCRRQASAQVDDRLLGNLNAEGPDRVAGRRGMQRPGKQADGPGGSQGGNEVAPGERG